MPTILVDFWQHVKLFFQRLIYSARVDVHAHVDGAQSIDPGPKSDDDVRQCHVAAGAAQ